MSPCDSLSCAAEINSSGVSWPVGLSSAIASLWLFAGGAIRFGIGLLVYLGTIALAFVSGIVIMTAQNSANTLTTAEKAEGWTLLCRAHAYSDLVVELINYDEEILHGGSPPRTASM